MAVSGLGWNGNERRGAPLNKRVPLVLAIALVMFAVGDRAEAEPAVQPTKTRNVDGLPASPFRTDDWPGVTK